MKLFFRKSGDGFPLIILHGLFGMSDNWASLAKLYAAEGYTVLVPDLRNHGQSPHADELTYEAMAGDLLALMASQRIDATHVVGHSMGGKTAMHLACMHPEKVSKLVVSDIAPRHYPPHQEDVLAALHAVDLDSVSSRSEAEKQMEKFLPVAGVRQFLLKSLFWKETPGQPGKKLAWRFHLPVIERDLENTGEGLPEDFRYEGPTLFVRGERSNYIATKDYNNIKHHFPHAVIETVPAAGHWVHADNPKGFSEVLLPFLHAT